MKRATVFTFLIAMYWIVRVVSAPAIAPSEVAATVDELQVMEAKHLAQQDWGTTLEEHAQITDAQ
ncbi:MAG: hypothetical protein KF799_14450 [Bdellovibrionales bacterium]|nr:hypothetical protein [Bdellovibrionales bacterium]